MGYDKARRSKTMRISDRSSIIHELRCSALFDAISDIGSATEKLSDAEIKNLQRIARGKKPIDIPRRRRG